MGCVDCTQLYNSQYCYDCIDCDRGYNLLHCINCFNCKDSSFLSQCTGCTNCFGCINLVHKEHYIFNEAYSAEEYAKEVSRLMHAPSEVQLRLQSLREIQPHRARTLINCEQCIGDYLIDCQNCTDVFTAKNCQDCTRVYLSEDAKDCWDCDIVGWPGELCYEGISTCANAVHNLFCNTSWGSTDIMYCDSCFDIRDCFGCVGLKKERYCILNKQYTKEEYEVLVPKIIESMREVGQYGEFFPVVISPFAYNESIVQEYFPLTKKEVIDKNWKWNEYETPLPIVEKVIAAPALPETIQDVPDDILQWAIECERTKRPFRITKQELDFYRRHEISVPRIHPDERHRIRIAQRNPRTLWNRSCVNCQKPIQTTYSPDRPEIIYCEECYLKEVY